MLHRLHACAALNLRCQLKTMPLSEKSVALRLGIGLI